MKKNTTNKWLSAFIILFLIGWGSISFAQDIYSEGERGIPDFWSIAGENAIPFISRDSLIPGKGYCTLISPDWGSDNDLAYSDGERGIPGNFTFSEEMNITDLRENGNAPMEKMFCLVTDPATRSFNDNFNYSLGDAGTVN